MQFLAFVYEAIIALIVTFAGATGMSTLGNPNPGFTNYGLALPAMLLS